MLLGVLVGSVCFVGATFRQVVNSVVVFDITFACVDLICLVL